jgi:hypothetical protein
LKPVRQATHRPHKPPPNQGRPPSPADPVDCRLRCPRRARPGRGRRRRRAGVSQGHAGRARAAGRFKPSKHFPGFEDAGRDARITILELPPPAFQKIERSVFAKTQLGLSEVKRESFPFQSGIGFLVSARAQKNDAKLRV